jgi:hypothetical protein
MHTWMLVIKETYDTSKNKINMEVSKTVPSEFKASHTMQCTEYWNSSAILQRINYNPTDAVSQFPDTLNTWTLSTIKETIKSKHISSSKGSIIENNTSLNTVFSEWRKMEKE